METFIVSCVFGTSFDCLENFSALNVRELGMERSLFDAKEERFSGLLPLMVISKGL